MKKRILGIMLALSMVLSLLPMTVLATEPAEPGEPTEETKVAAFGDEEYGTLQEAIEAAKAATEGGAITLIDNATSDAALVFDAAGTYVLDLNGKKLTVNSGADSGIKVTNGANLTLTNGAYEFNSTSGNTAAVYVAASSLNVTGVVAIQQNGASDNNAIWAKGQNTVVNISEGADIQINGARTNGLGAIFMETGSTLNMTGGKVTLNATFSNGYSQRNDTVGIVLAGSNVCGNISGGVFTINTQNAFAQGIQCCYANGNENNGYTLNGATFNINEIGEGEAYAFTFYYHNDGVADIESANVTVSAKKENSAALVTTGDNKQPDITITGGTFSVDPATYVPAAEGYTVVGNGPYYVGKDYTATFATTPQNATILVSLDGSEVSANGDGTYTLNSGAPYTYTVSASGYKTTTGNLEKRAGQEPLAVTVELQPQSSSSSSSGSSSSSRPSIPRPNPSSPTVESTTTTNPDGSTTTTEHKQDGTKVETTVGPDGSVTESASKSATVENISGTTTTTKTETKTETADGDKITSESVEKVQSKKDGTTVTTTTTETKTEAQDGSTKTEITVVETRKDTDGTETTTSKTETKLDNGSTGTTTVAADGSMKTEVTVSSAAVSEAPATLPMPAVTPSADNTVSVRLPAGTSSAAVEIPVIDVHPGVVAVIVNKDGTERIVKTAVVTTEGVALTVTDDVTLKLMDNSKEFEDVGESDWFDDAVTFVAAREIMNGTSPAIFQPTEALDRGMMAQILYNLEYNPETAAEGNIFTDVFDNDWYNDAVTWAAERGIITGYGDDTYGPRDNITREQLAAILYRYAASKGYDVSAIGDLSNFRDGAATSDWAVESMTWAVGSGIISGKGDGILDPTGNATRAEVATMVMKFCQNVVQ